MSRFYLLTGRSSPDDGSKTSDTSKRVRVYCLAPHYLSSIFPSPEVPTMQLEDQLES